MVMNECYIRKRIAELEDLLKTNEILYRADAPLTSRKILMQSFNIESQLQALHYVLGEEYKYKHL